MEGETQSPAGTPMGSGVRFERMPLEDLKPDPRNARAHGSRNMEAIVASLRRFGQQKPIVIDADGIVLAGNATLAAAREIGWTHIDVARSSLAGSDAMAYAIADNRTAELAEWDWEELKDQLRELEADGWDLADLALDAESLAPHEETALADRGPEADRENDGLYDAIASPIPPEEIPAHGSLWSLGRGLLLIACPIGDLGLWKPLLAPEIEMVIPYPSAHIAIAPRFRDRPYLAIQPSGLAAAYAIRIARAAGIEASEVGR